MDDLVGAVEIAICLGVDRTQVHKWRSRPTPKGQPPFPAPVNELTMGHVWSWPDIKRWALATGRTVKREPPVKPITAAQEGDGS